MVIIIEQRELKSKDRRTLTPKISLTILPTVCHKILMVSIWRIWYCINLKSPNWVSFFILLTCLLLWRESLPRSLIGAKGLSARNAINQAGIYVSFNWLRWCLRFETKITERSKANPSTPELPSDIPLKIALEGNYTNNIRNSTTTFFQLNMLQMIQWWSHQIWQT